MIYYCVFLSQRNLGLRSIFDKATLTFTLFRKTFAKNNLKYILDKNLSHINSLFHKFALAIHNLVYGEMIEQNIFELLFLNTEGNA